MACVALLLALAACSGGSPSASEPTQALIPATATPVPSPLPPTATPRDALPRPEDVAAPPATSVPTPSAPDGISADEDPVAAELVALAQRRLAQELNLPIARVQLVAFESMVWSDASLGCPLPGQTYPAGSVDGYRIVLSAGDRQYLFHTDFDRVLPCESANERLPEATESP